MQPDLGVAYVDGVAIYDAGLACDVGVGSRSLASMQGTMDRQRMTQVVVEQVSSLGH